MIHSDFHLMSKSRLYELNSACLALITRLLSESKLKRDIISPTCQLFITGPFVYKIRQIVDSNDPNLPEIYKFLKENFKQDELSSLETLKQKIDGVDNSGNQRPKYRCFYVEQKFKQNLERKILAVRISETFPMETLTKKSTNKNIFYGLYIAVDKDYRYLGLAKELYISSLLDAVWLSTEEQKEICAILAECTPDSEKLMNSVGLKRIFFEKGNTITELPYYQPALEFDLKTGVNLSCEVAEHLMLLNLSRGPTNMVILCDIIHSLFNHYEKNYVENDFENLFAYQKYCAYFQNLRRNIFQYIIYSGGCLRMLNFAEQYRAMQENFQIKNHTMADQR